LGGTEKISGIVGGFQSAGTEIFRKPKLTEARHILGTFVPIHAMTAGASLAKSSEF